MVSANDDYIPRLIPYPTPMAHPRVDQLDALTSLRFLAALYVVVFHYTLVLGPQSTLVSMGYTGVTFFFILSGFILTHNYASVAFSDRANLRNYLVARIARIYPVFLLSLVISLPFFAALALKQTPPWYQGLFASSAVFAPLGLHAWVPGAACALNCPSWSISTEFFFYAVLPFALPLVVRAPWRWLMITVASWLVIGALFVWFWEDFGHGQSVIEPEGFADATVASHLIKFFPIGRLPEFLLGIVIYCLWLKRRSPARIAPMLIASVVAAIGIVLLSKQFPEVFIHNGLTALAWAPLIMAAASMRSGILHSPVMLFLGRISFSLYLLHLPIANIVRSLDKNLLAGSLMRQQPALVMAATFVLALAASAVVFLWIEEPARRYITRTYKVAGPAGWPSNTGSATPLRT